MREKLATYRPLVLLGAFAIVSELGYAIVNISAMPMFVEIELKHGFYLGYVAAAYLLSEALFRAPLGVVSDRLGRKPFLIAAPLVSVVTALVTVRVHSVVPLFGLRVLDGAAAAGIWTAAYAAMGDATGEKRRAMAMSVINVSYMAGLALGPLAGGLVDDLAGARLRPFAASFYLAAGLFFIAAILALGYRPREGSESETVDAQPPEKTRLSAVLYTARIMPEMLALVFVTFLAIGQLIPIAKLFAYQDLGMSETHFGGALAPSAALLGLAAIPLGHLSDRWGRARSVKLGLGLAAVAMWVIVWARNLLFAGPAAGALGLGFVIGVPAYLAIVSERGEESRRGEVIGTAGMVQSLAAVAGAVIGNHLYHGAAWNLGGLALSAHRSPFALSAILLTGAAALAMVFVRDQVDVTCEAPDAATGLTGT